MANKQKDPFRQAKHYAVLLLKSRLHSEKEISQRLIIKKFSPGIIKQTIAFLKTQSLIDDRQFSDFLFESRLKQYWGLKKIIAELKAKDVPEAIINEALGKIQETYSEEDAVSEVIRTKIHSLKGSSPEAIKRRIYAYLLRRGFSPEIVNDKIEQLE